MAVQTHNRTSLQQKIKMMADKVACSQSALMPILQEIQTTYGYVPEEAMQDIADVLNISPVEVSSTLSFYSFYTNRNKGRYIIRVCQSLSCDMAGKEQICRQLEIELGIKFGQTTADGMFSLEFTNCLGLCDQGPALMVNDRLYNRVDVRQIWNILQECRKELSPSIHYKPNIAQNLMEKGAILTANPQPYAGLKKALEIPRADILNILRKSGLRGRGGAGFPTATKWQFAAAAQSSEKFVVCNADEGEPGTFKDRLLLLEMTEIIFDGMTIAGYVIGAQKGLLYLRAEYSFMRPHLEKILESRHNSGLLGDKVAGYNFKFDIEIRMGAGAYVCGEETSLIESMEGKRGEPRNRPPFPVNTGFNGHPTIVNNVETFVDVAVILDKGAEWFTQLGTEKSTGTKFFSVSGDCRRPGIYELPFGITIAELLLKVGGEDAKAVQVGGASGTSVPRKNFDRRIAFEDVASGGSIMVIGPHRNMLHIAKNFMEFFADESCGQCFPCRKGTAKLLDGIHKLATHQCSLAYLKELETLGYCMQKACKCGLGQSASNAFLDIVKNHLDEIFNADNAH